MLKSGTGTWILTGTNGYAGNTLIGGGTLVAKKSASLPGYNAPGKVTVNEGGTIAVRAGAATGEWADWEIDALRSHAVFNSGSFLGIDTTSNNFSYNSAIGESLGLTKLGSNTLTLTASNTFTGPVNFNGGLINAATLNNLGNGSDLNFNGGGLQFNGVFDPSVRTMTFQAGGATLDTQTNNIILNNAIGNSGPGGLRKLGTGTLTIAGEYTSYTGDTTIDAGTLQLGNNLQLPGKLNLTSAGSILEINNYYAIFGGLNGTAGSVRNSGDDMTKFLLLALNNGDCNYAGTIDGNMSLGIFGVEGAGIQTLSGINTYTGVTAIYGGQLRLGSDNPLPYGPGKTGIVGLLTLSPPDISILEMNGHELNINGLFSDGGGSVRNSGGSNTFTLGHNDTSGNYDGTIDGNLASSKSAAVPRPYRGTAPTMAPRQSPAEYSQLASWTTAERPAASEVRPMTRAI